MGYMRAVHYADSDVDRLTVITKTCIVYIGLSAVSTTHPYPANSLAGWLGWAGAGWLGGWVAGGAGWGWWAGWRGGGGGGAKQG